MEEHKILTSQNLNDICEDINIHILNCWSTKGELKVTSCNQGYSLAFSQMMTRNCLNTYELIEFNSKQEMETYKVSENTIRQVYKKFYNNKWYIVITRSRYDIS